ncbi:hypothetical protein AGJ34_22100 [Cronobacter dublinensis subsp. dublinensis]|nr:hypothetical protein [Cronobacter dublinensis subsp. dublinensis]EGT5729741.1 hypothetical protein [Cronobacter dublinensis subsp. dublinensis]
MTKFINLTTYLASDVQRELGVIDIDGNVAAALTEFLSFPSAPASGEMQAKAKAIADIAKNLCDKEGTINVLINAKSFFIPTLVFALQKKGLTPFYTFAHRSTKVSDGVVLNKEYVHKALVKCIPEA